MKRVVFAVGVAAIAVTAAFPVWSAGRATPSSNIAVVRAMQRSGPWTFACGGDTCVATVLDRLIVETPLGVDGLGVVVTLTLDYRTSPRDIGLVRLRFRTAGGLSGFLRPRTYPLTSKTRTSTTLTWSAHDLPGDGASYVFTPVFEVEERGRYGYSFDGQHIVMVAEFWN